MDRRTDEKLRAGHARIMEIGTRTELDKCAGLIREAFATVAREYDLTLSNSPSHPAFLKTEKLLEMRADGAHFLGVTIAGRLAGLVAVKIKNKQCYIEKLAVLSGFRHRGFGRRLMAAAEDYARERGSLKASIGIIDEKRVLKEWYAGMGFRITEIKQYAHLPFTVCMMEKTL